MKHILSICGALLLAASAHGQTTGLTINTSTGLINVPSGSLTPNFTALKVGGVTLNASASATLDTLGTTRGALLLRGASGWAILAPGTSGYVLQSNGSGADPTWHVAGAGGDMLKATYDPQDAGLISGAGGAGGVLNLYGAGASSGGSINTSGSQTVLASPGGSINTSGGDTASQAGGHIYTYSGTNAGGSIETHDGGGSISTRGTGSIELGLPATRTTLTGSATAARAIVLPDASGTVLLANTPRNLVVAMEATDYTQTGDSGGYVQLGTIGPSITIAAGSRVRVRTTGRAPETASASILMRLNIDSGASTVNLGRTQGAAEGMTLDSESIITGLAAGAHTVTCEYVKTDGGILFLRAVSQPTLERFGIILEEIP